MSRGYKKPGYNGEKQNELVNKIDQAKNIEHKQSDKTTAG